MRFSLSRALGGLLFLSGAPSVGAEGTPSPTPSPVPGQGAPLPKTYGMLLFRGYELLDVFGPLEALAVVARRTKIDLYMLAETLDPVTTEPLMPSMNRFNSSFFPTVNPTHTLADAPDIDVLIVPGGIGTRSPFLNDTIDWIAETYPKLQYLLTVCTGSALVAKSGILDGRRATTNKASWSSMTLYGPNVEWVPKARWVVDGNIWTSSGISAGIDATMAFIEHLYGADNATEIANIMEYERHTDPDWDPFSEIWGVPSA
ncbi:class I glutamine amidotransferase-like protein [Aspergillus carlsbadensis]|nr:class I glutamine amidotransferase-like protein [Aspergillus carlsbadensis]